MQFISISSKKQETKCAPVVKRAILSSGVIAQVSLLALAITFIDDSAAQARGWRAQGARGAAGGFARSGQYGRAAGIGGILYGRGAGGARAANLHGPNGGTFQGAGGGFVTPNAGAGAGAFRGTTPGGTNYAGDGVGAYKQGVGGFEHTNFNASSPNGSTFSGYTNGKYNAQTGQGTLQGSKQYHNGQTGQNYGYTEQTQFAKGQGGETTIDTQNKGDYQVDWQKGQKPTWTQTAAPTSSTSQ